MIFANNGKSEVYLVGVARFELTTPASRRHGASLFPFVFNASNAYTSRISPQIDG